jgi:hypothetical protein
MLDIDVNNYLKQTCKWEQFIEQSEYVPVGTYKEPEDIQCMVFGSKSLIVSADAETGTRFNKTVYIIDSRVSEKDRINGQLIESIADIPWFDGSTVLRECVLKG